MKEIQFSKASGYENGYYESDSQSNLNFLDLLSSDKNSYKAPDVKLPKDFQLTPPAADAPPLLVSADAPTPEKDEVKQPVDGGKALTIEHARTIVANRESWTVPQLVAFMKRWNPSDQQVAIQLFRDGGEVTAESIERYRNMSKHSADLKEFYEQEKSKLSPGKELDFRWTPRDLEVMFGPRPLEEYKNYLALMDRIGNPKVNLMSAIQPNSARTFAIAQTHLAKLPDATIKTLINHDLVAKHNLTSIPPKDIAKIITAARAWDMCPDLSLEIAQKVSEMSVKDQMRAALAWNEVVGWKKGQKPVAGEQKQADPEKFWTKFSELSKVDGPLLLKQFGETIMPGDTNNRQKAVLALTQQVFPEKSTQELLTIAQNVKNYVSSESNINPAEILLGINKKVFDKALQFKDSPSIALRSALVFQDYDQYVKYREAAGGYNAAIDLEFINSQTAKDLTGLSDWLIKPVEPGTNMFAQALVAESWSDLTAEQKQLGRRDLTDLVSKVREDLVTENPLLSSEEQTSKELRPVFLLVDRFPELSLSDKQLLTAVVLKQPKLAETIKPETLNEALKGWRIEQTFPEELAVKIASMPTWHQVAAKLAWNQTCDDPTTIGVRSDESAKAHHEKFLLAFEKQKAKGKMSVLTENGDPLLAAQSMFPKIPAKVLESLAQVCTQITPAGENAVKKLTGLQCGAYRDALAALVSKPGKPIDPQNIPEDFSPQSWQSRSAFSLSTVFGKEWQKWIDKMGERGVNAHDATHWLPVRATQETTGLKEFLFRNSDRDLNDLQKVAKRWHELKPEQKELKFKELIHLLDSVKYLNARSPEFAVENARWAISDAEYSKRENRYLASLNTPSPFPTDKHWESGNLKGYFLPRNDPRGIYLGNHTGCCQHPDGEAATSAWHGQESPNGGFFVVVDKTKPGVVLATSWAWVSDDGGLCFDSIEGINLTGREKDVMNVYKKAATDLAASKFHTVTVSTSSQYPKIAGTPESTVVGLKLPSNYSGYSDAKKSQQVLLAQNTSLPKRTDADKQTWVRGMTDADKSKANAIAKQVYPPGWQRAESGDFKLVLDNHKDGTIGYAVLNRETKEVHDIAVLPEHRSKSMMLLREVLKQIGTMGGEWTCSARESTSYAVLKLAEKRGQIKIIETKLDGEMNGEKMYAVKFEVIPQKEPGVETVPAGEKSGVAPQERQAVGRPATAPVRPKLSEKAVVELNKQLSSAIELLIPQNAAGKPPELKELTPEEFGKVLEMALTKMKNNPDVSSDELVLIDELQKLDPKSPTDATRLTALQTDLASLSSAETKSANAAATTGGRTTETRPNTKTSPAKSNEPLLPNLTIVTEALEKSAVTEKKEGKLAIVEEGKPKAGDTAAKKPGMKTSTKVVGGIGGLVGVLTVAEGTLQLYEWLNKDKEKEKDKDKNQGK